MLEIKLWDDPILRQVAQPFDDAEFGPQLEELSLQMIQTMDGAHGLGLAAPQVGISKRVFVMRVADHKTITAFNPQIVLDGQEYQHQEGCLSFPGLYEQVIRMNSVTMQYRTASGEYNEVWLVDEGENIEARIIQHEVDHLNGIMFFDRMSRQMRKTLLRRWEKR